ncbi:MAG: hypothetical protein JRI68_06565 [Deltaproteobacteria bacterium]|nr:hypothetical protein [Deltaproteobacteria bacterium]
MPQASRRAGHGLGARRAWVRLGGVAIFASAVAGGWPWGCGGSDGDPAVGGGQPDGGQGGQGGQADLNVDVRVIDPEGAPVADAWVMMGGQPQELWQQTDGEGRVSLTLVDDGWSEPWVLVGKTGWLSGGVPVDLEAPPAAPFDITMRPLPQADNPDYAFQPGGDGSSMDTRECGHCHWTIGDDWAGSAHRRAADNPRTWDLYTGSAAAAADLAACNALSGQQADGQSPGAEGQTEERCYVGQGVLPWLNDGCGVAGQKGCDHPEERDGLDRFGGCGDCHSPATTGGIPGQIDLAASFGVAFEGVTCDFCHKVRAVDPGPSAGLNGGITLHRPSEDTVIPGQVFDPIIFGPYPDVIVPIMKGSYSPQHREAGWCASCHEHAQDALHPDESIAQPQRFPDGLPIQETYGEYLAWAGSANATCQTCHMLPIDEESSTYDISAQGLNPSVNQGWLRELGQVRHHDVPAAGLAAPSLDLQLAEVGGQLEATVTLTNGAAGHAVPTGEPMRQLIVLVSATNGSGDPVAPVGGQTVPDFGGALHAATVGTDAQVNGSAVSFAGQTFPAQGVTALRFARPTGNWDDYAGPGTAPFTNAGLTPEQKGLEKLDFLGERAVVSVAGGTVDLESAPPALQADDVVFVLGSEAHQAGAPGWAYAKVLVDSSARRGVAHYRAVDVASDNRIAASGSASSAHRFPLPAQGESVAIEVKLVRRRFAASVADLYGWDVSDAEAASTVQQWTQP